ncbi:hypothetical protein C8J57DRAFT_581915 [Mycena rebaudengoi]|nr:hypothetical protein C8J57DRAFT_581915 [Mycena rebaudengoi]
MSRLSRANLRGRDSVFAGGPDLYRGDIQAICPPSLEECVMIMEDCCEEAQAAQELLHEGARDLPRMNQVLQSQRVFLLVGDETVRKYKSDLTDEIEPAINELIQLAEARAQVLAEERGRPSEQGRYCTVKNVAPNCRSPAVAKDGSPTPASSH